MTHLPGSWAHLSLLFKESLNEFIKLFQVSAAKEIAEENDKKVEEAVRKLMLAELNRDRAEAKADRNDNKIQSEWNIQHNFSRSSCLM